jgi:hypothetical protein
MSTAQGVERCETAVHAVLEAQLSAYQEIAEQAGLTGGVTATANSIGIQLSPDIESSNGAGDPARTAEGD